MDARGLDFAAAAPLVAAEMKRQAESDSRSPARARKGTLSALYLEHITLGYQAPSWELAKAMAAVTGGFARADEIKDYRRPAEPLSESLPAEDGAA